MTDRRGCQQVSLVLEPPVALNTARISEGLLSLRFPRTRLFAASAPVGIQVSGPLPHVGPVYYVCSWSGVLGCCRCASRAMHGGYWLRARWPVYRFWAPWSASALHTSLVLVDIVRAEYSALPCASLSVI